MDKSIEIKYSVIYAGQVLNIEDIKKLLYSGRKVIWFGIEKEIKTLISNFPDFNKERYLSAYLNIKDINLCIIDGKMSSKDRELLDDLARINRDFNLEQFVVEHENPNEYMIVQAGAGAGKTKVMIDRIMFLLHTTHNFSFDDVAMVTFTNAATDSMREKIYTELNTRYKLTGQPFYVVAMEQIAQLNISTIHAFFKNVITEVGPVLGYGSNISLRGYISAKKSILRDLMDEKYEGKNKRVEDVLGFKIHEIEGLAMTYWEKLDNKGISESEVSQLDWGNTSGDKEALIQDTLVGLFDKVNDRYNRIKYINNAISMSDIIHELSRVIDRPEIKKYINNSYKYLFVDEFQDSDNVQIKVIALLMSAYNGQLFVVGDLKQSIYRFRGSTDSAFLKLLSWIEDSKKKSLNQRFLKKNYRTSMDILNKLDPIFKNWGKKGWLNYESIDVMEPMSQYKGVYRQLLVENISREKKVIEIIENILTDKKHGRVMFLVRKNRELLQIQKWCKKAGKLCLIKEKGTFYKSPAVLDFLAMVEAYFYNNEPSYRYNYEMSSYTENELDIESLCNLNGKLENVIKYFNNYKKSEVWEKECKWFIERPVMAVIRNLTDKYNPVENFVIKQKRTYLYEGLSEEDASNQAILEATQYDADLQKLLQILRNQFSGEFATLVDLCSFLRMKVETDTKEDQADVKKIEQIDYVEGMTVHSAKGLEFDNVLIPFMNNSFYETFSSDIIISQDQTKIGWIYKSNKDRSRAGIYNDYYSDLIDEDEQEVIKEETRLLYVAMTRAIGGLYCFPCRTDKKYKNSKTWSHLLPKIKDEQ